MRIIAEILLAGALFIAMAALWRVSGRACFTPVPKTPGTKTYILITVAGSGAGLEQTVYSIKWLNSASSIGGAILLADDGLDETGRRVAELLERGDKSIILCRAEDVPGIINDTL